MAMTKRNFTLILAHISLTATVAPRLAVARLRTLARWAQVTSFHAAVAQLVAARLRVLLPQPRLGPLLTATARLAVTTALLATIVLTSAGTTCAEATTPGPAGKGPVIKGRASVVDGDGLEIGGTKIRLHGIDAPESAQRCPRSDGTSWPCGEYAAVALDRLIQGKDVACDVHDHDRYGRPVAVCRAGGVDVGGDQVRHGWAIVYRRYSNDYVDEEAEAKKATAGIWQGRFEEPEHWRHRQHGSAPRKH
jgi:endonuclease YncB( thermonuclease family)